MKKQIVSLILAITTLGYSPKLPAQACGGGEVGYIDKKEKVALQPPVTVDNINDFSEGLSAIWLRSKYRC